jgi:hypothetical protein
VTLFSPNTTVLISPAKPFQRFVAEILDDIQQVGFRLADAYGVRMLSRFIQQECGMVATDNDLFHF